MSTRNLAQLSFFAVALVPAFTGGCGTDEPFCPGLEPDYAPVYDNVECVVSRSCSFSTSCHGGSTGQVRLNFERYLDAGEPITLAFQNADGTPRAACEYDLMPVVDPGNPDNSWLMMKIDGMVTADGMVDFTPDPTWMPATGSRVCPRRDMGVITFGIPMPYSEGRPTPLPAEEIEMIREWIRLGALGPS
jgi:hypothetical protein